MGWNSSSFPNFNGAAAEVWEWKINFMPHFLAMRLLIHTGINADPWFNKGPWSYLRETPCGTMFTWARYPAMYVRHMSSLIYPGFSMSSGSPLSWKEINLRSSVSCGRHDSRWVHKKFLTYRASQTTPSQLSAENSPYRTMEQSTPTLGRMTPSGLTYVK